MTYFLVKNYTTGHNVYFVPDETIAAQNTYITCAVGGLAEANEMLAQVKAAFLVQEDYRFSIAKEIVEGNNTIWINADLVNDTEEYTYHVFNTITGLHEQVSGLTNAKIRLEEIKQEFLVFYGLENVITLDSLPAKPQTYSAAIYGQTVGDIPVQEM